MSEKFFNLINDNIGMNICVVLSPIRNIDGSSKNANTDKGIVSAPSKVRETVTENKDNADKDYPIHHNDSKDNKETDKYFADARQFVTFTTKNGKIFHLIINHDLTEYLKMIS